MQFRQLLSRDGERAVSPVIGVILMVAITVILAAVIASFVLGLGDSQEVQPTATFDFDYDPGNDVTVTHTGGDSISDTELFIRGNDAVQDQDDWDTLGGDASGSLSGQSAVVSGDSLVVDVADGANNDEDEYVLRVVWESSDGGSSSELASDRGPAA